MPILDHVKMDKLAIEAYAERARSGSPLSTFEAMYNPTSIKNVYQNRYSTQQPLGSISNVQTFIGSGMGELSLTLILDGSGLAPNVIETKTIAERVQNFLTTAYSIDGKLHAPRYLKVHWGKLTFWGESSFHCVLNAAEITYTNFKRDGSPLRAELAITLIQDEDPPQSARSANRSSPDLTHHRVVKSGDTLPMLCREIYGDAGYYLHVAEFNTLNHFRRLRPGQVLYFPPLDNS